LGSGAYLGYLEQIKVIKIVGKDVLIKKKTIRSFPSPFFLTKKFGMFKQAHDEIGAYRALDVFKVLLEEKTYKITLRRLKNAIERNNAPDSSIGCGIQATMGKGRQRLLKGHITADHVYKKRKKRGDYNKETKT